VCICSLCVALSADKGLARGLFYSRMAQGVRSTVYRIEELKNWQRPNKMAIEPLLIIMVTVLL
jgi:hypothetical protein